MPIPSGYSTRFFLNFNRILLSLTSSSLKEKKMKWSLLDDFSSQFLLKRQTFLFFSFSKTAAWLKYRKNIVEPLVEWEFVASMSRQKREPARYGLWNVEATVGIADDPVFIASLIGAHEPAYVIVVTRSPKNHITALSS